MFSKRLAAAVAAAALIPLAACAPPSGGNDAAASEGGAIPVGVIADLTGATGDVGTPYNKGMLGYVDWINSQGGIEGRKLEATSKDYAYDVPTAERLYKEYLNAGAVAVQGWGTGDSEALSSKVTQDEVPFMSASYAEALTDPAKAPYNFVVAPTYSDQARVGLNWIDEDSDGTAQVAFFHHDSPFGLAPLQDSQNWIKEKGLDIALQAYPMPAGAANYVGLLARAKAQGAKYVMIQNVSSPGATVARDIAAQKLDMKIVCLIWCADELFIQTAGAAAEGHVLVQPFAPVVNKAPGHEVIEKYLASKGSSLDKETLHYVQGWYTMHILAEGIRKVIKDGGEVTGPAIKQALETMGPIDTGGVIGTGKVEFSAQSHRGQTGTGVYEVKSGAISPIATGVTP